MIHFIEEITYALKKGRKAKGLSQRALSTRTGLPQSHISRIENGSTNIRLSSLIALARALNLEVKLIPRRALPAVESIVRSTSDRKAGTSALQPQPAYRLEENDDD